MRIGPCLAIAFAALAAVSARADDQAARWVGRWKMYTETMATPMYLTLKDAGGKLTGTVDPGEFGIAMLRTDTLRLKLNDAFGAILDCKVALKPGGSEFEGDCHYHNHGRDERRHLTGERQ